MYISWDLYFGNTLLLQHRPRLQHVADTFKMFEKYEMIYHMLIKIHILELWGVMTLWVGSFLNLHYQHTMSNSGTIKGLTFGGVNLLWCKLVVGTFLQCS